MNSHEIEQSLMAVKAYVEREKFQGYDPYDILNSNWPFRALGKWGPVLAIQFQKRNPINLRPILGVKKGYNPKGMGLLLHAYSQLYSDTRNESDLEQMRFIFDWLLDNSTKGYSGLCWGYNFDWASPVKYLKAYSPSIVVSGFIAKGIFAYYQTTKDDRAKDALLSIGNFVLNDLDIFRDETGICFSYTTMDTDACYNASMLGAELMSFLFYLTGEQQFADKAQQVVDFTMARQQQEGHWNYSLDLKTGNEKRQIDFHQGYILDSILNFLQYSKVDDKGYWEGLKKGVDYYYREQFFPTGRSKWRIPKVWPVEIHNQSQGILTFTRLRHLDERNLSFAKQIASWTIQHMQDPRHGFFYYKKYPTHTIRIPYMRWAQSWMLLALTELNHALKEPKEEKIPKSGVFESE